MHHIRPLSGLDNLGHWSGLDYLGKLTGPNQSYLEFGQLDQLHHLGHFKWVAPSMLVEWVGSCSSVELVLSP